MAPPDPSVSLNSRASPSHRCRGARTPPIAHAPVHTRARFFSAARRRRLEPHSPLPRRPGNLTPFHMAPLRAPGAREPCARGRCQMPLHHDIGRVMQGSVRALGGRQTRDDREKDSWTAGPPVRYATQQSGRDGQGPKRRGLAAADQKGAQRNGWPPCAWRQAPGGFLGPFPIAHPPCPYVGFVAGGRRQKQGSGRGRRVSRPAVALRSRRVGGGRDQSVEVLRCRGSQPGQPKPLAPARQ